MNKSLWPIRFLLLTLYYLICFQLPIRGTPHKRLRRCSIWEYLLQGARLLPPEPCAVYHHRPPKLFKVAYHSYFIILKLLIQNLQLKLRLFSNTSNASCYGSSGARASAHDQAHAHATGNNRRNYGASVTFDIGFDSHSNINCVGKHQKSLLHNYRKVSHYNINTLSGMTQVIGIGTLVFYCVDIDGNKVKFKIDDCLHVDGDVPLLCVEDFINMENVDYFKKYNRRAKKASKVKLFNGNEIKVQSKNKLLYLSITVQPPLTTTANAFMNKLSTVITACTSAWNESSTAERDINLAHSQMCHPSQNKMDLIQRNQLVLGFSWKKGAKLRTCYPCSIGNSQQKIDKNRSEVAEERGAIIFTDILSS